MPRHSGRARNTTGDRRLQRPDGTVTGRHPEVAELAIFDRLSR